MEKPFIPFYIPYGMSEEEYMYELYLAEQKLTEWEQYMKNKDEIGDILRMVDEHYVNVSNAEYIEFIEELISDLKHRKNQASKFNKDQQTNKIINDISKEVE